MDEPRPPYLLCCMIAFATVIGVGAVLVRQNEQDESAMTAAVSASAEDLSQVIKLKKIYSEPPEPEDTSKYKDQSQQQDNSRGPAK